MRPRLDPSPELLELADLQAGVLSTRQLRGYGLPRRAVERLVRQEHWRRLDRSVYLTQPQEPSWTALGWAGGLLGGCEARLGGTGGALLHDLLPTAPTPITVLVPLDQVTRSRHPWCFRRESPGVRESRSPGSPPRTTVEDTVLDLCDESTPSQVIGWVTQAVQSRRTTVAHLRRAL